MAHTRPVLDPSEVTPSSPTAISNSGVNLREPAILHREEVEGSSFYAQTEQNTSWACDNRPCDGATRDVPGEEKKRRGWPTTTAARLGLDKLTLITMVKGSLAPVIGLAMLQSRPIALYFSTLGYLVPIVSVFGMCVLPRGKFFANLVLTVFAVCVGSAVCMLALWTAVEARRSTMPREPPPTGAALPPYNSSQSAVCAIWLFANIWAVNLIRAKRPAFNLPVITYCMLANMALTLGPIMTTTAAARMFIKKALTAMLSGLSIATAVSLLVLPVSSRQIVFRELACSIRLLRELLSLQKAYLASLGPTTTSPTRTRTVSSSGTARPEAHQGQADTKMTNEAVAAKALEQAGAQLRGLMGQLRADLPFAKRDIAWGKLDAEDLNALHKLLRSIYIPVLGMNTMIDIIKRFSEPTDQGDPDDDTPGEKEMAKHDWKAIMRQIGEPFELLSGAISQGLEHAAVCLELLPRPQRETPVRAAVRRLSTRHDDLEVGREPEPGDRGFTRAISDKMAAFQEKTGELLKRWLQERGIDLDGHTSDQTHVQSERDQVQLYIILYLETLMHESGEAVQNLVVFADAKVRDGTMSRKRLLAPTLHRLRKWSRAIFGREEESVERSPEAVETGARLNYCFGSGFATKRDLEHLPPTTAWQRAGDKLRKITALLSSEESAFGLRVACATMTVGILAFLKTTEQFFREFRLVWATLIITIGMTITSGQSFFGFLCRIAGTILAMVLSLVSWYIVDGKAPGVIIFLWLSLFICYYLYAKHPRLFPAVILCIVTQVMIIGYELEVLLIGLDAAQQTGQTFHPTYLLAQYRVACVAGGVLVAFIWTIFPYPLTDRTWLRRELSSTLYHLANYFAIISSAVKHNARGDAGDVDVPGTPAHRLFKASCHISSKTNRLLESSAQHAEWEKWEPTVGGRFPREDYEDIIRRCNRIMAYMVLTSYILLHPAYTHESGQRPRDDTRRRPCSHSRYRRRGSRSCSRPPRDHDSEELRALPGLLDAVEPAHHTIMSTLTLLSHSLLSGQSLPPFLPLPRPYDVARQLMRLRRAEAAAAAISSSLDLGREREDDDESISDSPSIRMVDTRTGLEDLTAEEIAAAAVEGRLAGIHPLHRHYRPGSELDATGILDVRNIEKPGYAEFAVLQVCTTLVCHDLEGLMRAVSGLVGVVDFGFGVGGCHSSVDVRRGDGNNGKRKTH